MGHRELCVIHLVEEHARERSEEGHRLPHEEEPVTARSQAEGSVCGKQIIRLQAAFPV